MTKRFNEEIQTYAHNRAGRTRDAVNQHDPGHVHEVGLISAA
jgi:hypothetical protein